jgi:hypothetical protein
MPWGFLSSQKKAPSQTKNQTSSAPSKSAPSGAAKTVTNLQKTAGNQAVAKQLAQSAAAKSSSTATKKDTVGLGLAKVGKSKNPDDDPRVMAALEVFATKKPGTVTVAANTFAKAGVSAKDKNLGKGVVGSGSASATAQAGGWATASALNLEHAYAVLVEANVIVGGSLQLDGELKRQFGKYEAAIKANVNGFVGATANAKGHARIDKGGNGSLPGIDIGGEASAFAGAKGQQQVEASFTRGDVGVAASAELKEMAGVQASADGVFALSKNNIALGGEFSAFAGAKVTGTAKGALKLYGREALSQALSGTVSVGHGAEGGGRFQLRRGVLYLKLHGHVAHHAGVGVGADTAVDFKPIAVWIYRQIDKQYWKANQGEANKILDNPESVRQKLTDKLTEYAKAKQEAILAEKADNFVKLEKVQQIVGNVLPRKQVKGHKNAAVIDTMIKEVIELAFDLLGEKKVQATVKDGKVEKIDNLPDLLKIKRNGPLSHALAKKGVEQGINAGGIGTQSSNGASEWISNIPTL